MGAKSPNVNVRLINPGSAEHKRPHRGINDEVHDPGGLSWGPNPF